MAGADAEGSVTREGARYKFEFYSSRPPYWSFDGLPFGSAYGAALAVLVALVSRAGSFAWEHLLVFLVPAALHVLLFLATQWSVEARCFVRFQREEDIGKATHVKVVPEARPNVTPKVLLVPVQRQDSEVSLSYLKRKFTLNSESRTFERIRYDLTSPLGCYLNSSGLSSKEVISRAKRYGENTYDIPLPTFGELFQEHAVAPFFVFQLFCVLLWLMDEYWYYSLLTLFMLIVLEAQMVHRRRSDLSELRAMRIPPRSTYALRDGTWKTVQSNELVPGDIIGICRSPEASFPCDVLLLQGNVLVNEAMLTGESVPQMKVCAELPPDSETGPGGEALDMMGRHKPHVVSAGTNVMMHQNTEKSRGNFKKVPAAGATPVAVGYVLRTGFDTTQGKLCRTILFSADRVTVSSREALYFIMILLVFAIMACIYVLYDGLVLQPLRVDEAPRSTFKLILSVSHIITSVVPPEFPIMLSLAVNLSLVALVQKRIFCTEPFRVPLAGRIQTCCFDKTGTLTSDSMEVGGVHGLPDFAAPALAPAADEKEEAKLPAPPLEQKLPFLATAVMTACSGLTLVEHEIVGDPLEKAALQAVRWLMIGPDLVTSKPSKGSDRLQILRRYPFASELQRMAVLVQHQGPGLGHLEEPAGGARKDFDRILALVKGSCDALKPRLLDVPSDLDVLQDQLTKAGFRVLCMAAKEFAGDAGRIDVSGIAREKVECDLHFCGLLVLRNSVKPNTSSTIRQLRKSYHRVVMITGDHPLTACQVASNVSMAEGRFLVLEVADAKDGEQPSLEWRSWDLKSKVIPFQTGEALSDLAKAHTLCVPGAALGKLSGAEVEEVAEAAVVFARVSPQQKEQVVLALNRRSHTVMVGDGTNDVGALKHAHVGVSLLTTTVVPPSQAGLRAPKTASEMMADNGQAPLVRLGDASIASPFTYKGDSIKCSLQVLRSGRATLCSVLMMYKIMGLNSIMSAFAMSALTLDGVKLGDSQTAIESLFTSMCFFLVSKSAPAKTLAKQQPISSVFEWSVMLTLACQLVIHLIILFHGWQLANEFRPKDFKRDLEGEFEPNLTNSVVFILMAAMHASSFLANYDGHPFMQPLSANKPLMYSLMFFVTVVVTCASEVVPDLNSSLSLVLSPNEEFRQKILMLVVADIGISFVISRAIGTLAISLRGQAAEKRAQRLGLGMRSADEEPKAKKKSKDKEHKVKEKAAK
eukprot:TRINITY_DN6504_c0_g2_i1.p1 TRINITY_DN6504_c0_g2~~TRINITY_DN6504_c0_g2_i1.p1  ORF type:complete len:1208 (+),score=273.18 TRINITY_DN6504_c0_g2_i1:55-3678(+)